MADNDNVDNDEFDGDMDILNSVDEDDDKSETPEEPEDETIDNDKIEEDENKEDDKEDETDEDEKDEDDEDEQGDEDKDEDKEEEVQIGPRVTIKGIKSKFPDFFKQFPTVRDMIFSSEKMREFFPSVEDAKNAAEKNEVFDNFEASIMSGDPGLILQSIARAEGGEQILEKFAVNFLPRLSKVSPDTVSKVVNPLIANVLKAAMREGKSVGNKNLFLASKHLSNYYFGSPDVPEEKPTDKKEDPEKQQLRTQLQQREAQDMYNYRERVVTKGTSDLEKLIERHADPKKELTPFLRKSIIRDVKDAIIQRLDASPQHDRLMDSLWRRARQNGLKEEDVPRLINAFLGSAKQLLPGTIKRIKSEALGRKKKNPQLENFKGGGKTVKGTRVPPKNTNWDKTTDLDAFSGNFKTK